jgi:two-component system OmpR family sensor kinase
VPIRWRLTIWFSLILLAILILSGVLLNVLLQHYLDDEVDNNLITNSARVHGTLHGNINSPLDYNVIHSSLPAVNEFSSPGIYIELLDLSGRAVVKSDNLGALELPVSPVLIDEGAMGLFDIQTVTAADGARVRILVSPMYTQNQTLLLEVGQSLQTVDSMMSQLRFYLAVGILLALSLSGVLGALLVRRTLAPVERITRTARSIEQSPDLNRRVGYKGPMDEIGRLATTFDYMIGRLNKLFESQKRFIADASHELRTPLTVIQGNIGLLKRNFGEEDRQESLRAIESESKRMAKVANDLLFLAEVDSDRARKRDEVSLKEIMREEVNRAQTFAGARKIMINRLEDLCVKGDSYQLKQLLGNLVDNAVKYTPDGGKITLSLFHDNEWARLEVADNGIGIAPEHLPYIFSRFYRVDKARSRATEGSGLGLAIVKGIAEQHGGKVTVTSELGQGSTFTVWLKI